jgi:hypothetical protein
MYFLQILGSCSNDTVILNPIEDTLFNADVQQDTKERDIGAQEYLMTLYTVY